MFTVLVLDASGTEVGRYEAVDEATGLISIGGGPQDHILVPDLPAAQLYLYVTEGQMVIEDPEGTGQVTLDGYLLDQPSYAAIDSDILVAGYWVRLVAQGGGTVDGMEPPPPPPPQEDEPQEYFEEGGAVQVAADLAYAPGGPALAKGRLFLEGIAGPVHKQKIPLETGQVYDVGRDRILEINLDDPSVSRRHARITVNEGGITLLDLRSSNGTYVNGERIKRQVVLPGDHVRFGEVAFRVKQEGSEAQSPRRKAVLSPRQTALATGLAALLAVGLVVGLGIKRRMEIRAQRKVTTHKVTAADKKRMKIQRLLEQAHSALDHAQWTRALELIQQAGEMGPGPEARARAADLAAKAHKEMDAQKNMAEADRIFETAGSNLDLLKKAARLYKSVPTDSYYGAKAVRSLDKLAIQIARQYESSALGLINARSLKRRIQGQRLLCQYFSVIGTVHGAVPGEGTNRERLRKLEKILAKRLRNSKNSPFQPCKARRFLYAGLAAATGPNPAVLLSAKYPKKIADALLFYQQGHMDRALVQLMKLRDKRSMKPHKQLLSDLQERLGLIKGKLASVDAAIQRNDAAAADQALRSAIEIDKKVLPSKLQGFEIQEAAHRLANLYFRLGETQFRSKRYREAFQNWKRGLVFESSHPKLIDGLARLEKAAVGTLRTAQSLQSSDPQRAKMYFQQVRDMTTLESPLHLQAVQGLSKLK